MIHPAMLLAQTDLGDFVPSRQNALAEALHEAMILIGIMAGLCLFFVAWAAFFRRRARRRRRHHGHATGSASATITPTGVAAPEANGGGSHRRRRRRSRGPERPLNRTLAETRGLPPVREDDAPPPGL